MTEKEGCAGDQTEMRERARKWFGGGEGRL